MKLFTEKGIVQKIIIAVIIVTLLNFMIPTVSSAFDVGGLLFEPITDLVTTIGDSILSALQRFLYDGNLGNFQSEGGVVKSTASGLANILLGANWFISVQSDEQNPMFPEMVYEGGDPNEVVINESEFDGVSLYDAAAFLINPFVGLGNIALKFTGISKKYVIPTIQYSIDKIFAGEIPAFDVNFINPSVGMDDEDKQDLNIAYQLQGVISDWYYALRNLAIVGLLSILVYVGIRIIISSTASDKAKYKQMLKDWLVALCLLFFLHYIMAFTLEMINVVNGMIANSTTSIPVVIHTEGATITSFFDGDIKFKTDMMGLTRLQIQYEDFSSKIIYLIIYIGLLVYTVKYTWIYMKRTITMMFLTLVAPLVALTYPIDKLNDGKAQAFNTWIKEYIFTALLQPFHLILYSILMGSALGIATTNPIYALLVIAFMGPAEKMLRKFFGFDKASSPGTLSQAGAMFGGAAAFKMLQKSAGFIANRKHSSGKGNDVRTKDTPVEDRNAPDGYDAFTNRQIPTTNEQGNGDSSSTNQARNINRNQETEALPRGTETGQEGQPPLQGSQDDSLVEGMHMSSSGLWLPDESLNIRQREPERPQPPEEGEQGEGQNDRPSRLRSAGQTAWRLYRAPAKAGVRQLKEWKDKHFGDKDRTIRTLKSAAKGTLKLGGRIAAAGTMGAIGIGMGIAGDDLEDVLTIGATGATLGATLAPSVGRSMVNSNLAQSIGDDMQHITHGGSTNAAEIARQSDELYRSGELREWAQDTFLDENGNKYTGEELNKLEDRAIGHYNAGFTDKSDIKKVMKLEDKLRKGLNADLPEAERDDKSKAMAETIGKLAKDIQPGKLSDQKYVDGKLDEFTRGIQKANKDLSSTEARNNAKQMMNLIMQYYKKP